MPVLELREARVSAGARTLVEAATLSVSAGECIAIMGPSGSGKSTLLQTVVGIRPSDPDQVFFDGQDLASLGTAARDNLRLARMGMVFQFGELLPELSALENVAMPSRYLGMRRSDAHTRAARWLDALGLADLHDARPDRLSGGQVQRVAVARAVAHDPRLIVADEPTGMLDGATSREVVRLLVECARSAGAALLIVTHDHQVAAACDRVLALDDGRLEVAA